MYAGEYSDVPVGADKRIERGGRRQRGKSGRGLTELAGPSRRFWAYEALNPRQTRSVLEWWPCWRRALAWNTATEHRATDRAERLLGRVEARRREGEFELPLAGRASAVHVFVGAEPQVVEDFLRHGRSADRCDDHQPTV